MRCLNKTVKITGTENHVRMVKFSRKTNSLLGGIKIKRDNLFLFSRRNKDTFTISIRNDIADNSNSYKLAQIDLTKEDLISLRDEINKAIEENW